MIKKLSPPTVLRSLKLNKTTDDAAFDAAQLYARQHGRKAFGVSSMLRTWIEIGRAVYAAKNLDEALQVVRNLFETYPVNLKRGQKNVD